MTKKCLYLVLFLYLASNNNSSAQIDSSEVNASPYGVIYNHLYYLQEDSYDPAMASRSFQIETPNKDQVAIKLKKILDGKGMYVDINRLPIDNNYIDTINNESIFFIDNNESKIYVEKMGTRWFYSKTTIDQVPQLYKDIFPFDTSINKYFYGPFWEYKFFKITIVQYLGLLIIFLFGILTFYILKIASKWMVTKIIRKQFNISPKVEIELPKLSRLLALLMSTRVLYILFPMLQLPIKFSANLLTILGILSIFFIILSIIKVVHIAFHYFDTFAKKTKNTLDDQLLPAARKIIEIIIWAVGIIYVLDFLGINVTALLAGISIGGLAIALAAQDTVKNFFGSIMIFIDRPFQIGDWISFDGIDGTVEEVGIRSTRIRSFANSIIYVPNGMLTNKVVNNMGLRQFRRFKTELSVTYNTPLERINLFVDGIRSIINQHPATRKDAYEVHLNSFGGSSINILLYCFLNVSDWTEELEGRHELMYAILLLAQDLNVSFAFPSQSIYIESMPSKTDNTITKTDGQEQLDSSLKKISSYFNHKVKPTS